MIRWALSVIVISIISEAIWLLLAYLTLDMSRLATGEWEKIHRVMCFLSILLGLAFGTMRWCLTRPRPSNKDISIDQVFDEISRHASQDKIKRMWHGRDRETYGGEC